MNITVVGLGYVGLVTAACLAKWGHSVRGLDSNGQRLQTVATARAPFHEPALDELIAEGMSAGRLTWTSSAADAVAEAEAIFIAVGTHDGNGGWQTDTLTTSLAEIVPLMSDHAALVIRSTLPPPFVASLAGQVSRLRREVGRPPVAVILNPEFTREGSALTDFMEPERVVLGRVVDLDNAAVPLLERLYQSANAPILVMPGIDAALAKLGANLFLATKISFANELAAICDGFGGTVDNVVAAMAYDKRIGGSFMGAGVGFGGSCLPNQVAMMVKEASRAGIEPHVLRAVDWVNHHQREHFVDQIARALGGSLDGKCIALLGLAFKPNTDDLRDAPSLTIARLLLERGALVVATDPMPRARSMAGALHPQMRVSESPEEAMTQADVLAIVTEWPEYRALDWRAVRARMRGNVVIDGRNCLMVDEVVQAGLRYIGLGRSGPIRETAPQGADGLLTRRVPDRIPAEVAS